MNVSTCTLEWIDTRITYAAIVARGSPFVEIVVFKHNENKLYRIFSINNCTELENPENLEQNPNQTYHVLPSNTSLSMDGEFLQITSFDGRVRVLKMPPIIDPISSDKHQESMNAASNSNLHA